jgi:molybdate transport system ATP-binding protein
VTLTVRDVVLPLADFTFELSVQLSARTTGVYGPSGAGKTTLLELIAGLRTPRSGRIELNGRVVCDGRQSVPPRLRNVGYVPQDDALFPHLSVERNVAYGAREWSPAIIDVLELGPLLARRVTRLSGGERKRVALARALMTRPEILLLDEPLAGVDLALRDRVLEYLVNALSEFPIPALYVTHHLEEAEAICDEIVMIERGRLTGRRELNS